MTAPAPWLAALAARLPPAPRTRWAPAPTGRLHLGHVANALLVWGIARALGGRVLLRLEDHDRTRCRAAFDAGILDDLDWLGLVPDEGPVRQSARDAVYDRLLARLDAQGLLYACACSRKSLGPGEAGAERRYPGTCRDRGLPRLAGHALRVRLPAQPVAFDDALLGPQRQDPGAPCGDLVVRDRNGCWTYQFAVVADDLDQGIDLVIRGRDLLDSTGRQCLLAALLGRAVPPVFGHHPLLVHPDGRKLSKSEGATGLAELRAAGVGPADVLGIAAARLGLLAGPRPVGVTELPALVAAADPVRLGVASVRADGPLAG